jgi:hypothetical protein
MILVIVATKVMYSNFVEEIALCFLLPLEITPLKSIKQ